MQKEKNVQQPSGDLEGQDMVVHRYTKSKIWEPLKIANGKIKLQHRIVLAPLTRTRGVPLEQPTSDQVNRIWYPDELFTEYYAQRATKGGLLVTEALPVSQEGNGALGAPGLFHPSHLAGWREVNEAVHAKGGFIYAQLWHAGRTTLERITGMPTVAPSLAPWDDSEEFHPYYPPGHTTPSKYIDYPPIELSKDHIRRTIVDYCEAAKMAMEAGFDGVEVHGANGYLPEQFLMSNVNKRTDEYGGTPEKRCRFVVELVENLAQAIGGENCAIRLSPFGLLHQSRGEKRIETYSSLCEQLKEKVPTLSYMSLIEPRFEQLLSGDQKDSFLHSWMLEPSSLNFMFVRKIMGSTPLFTAGGWNDTNMRGVLESGEYDAFIMGRYFISNPDLVERLRVGRPLAMYDRDTFYYLNGEKKVGYTDYPTWDGIEEKCRSESEGKGQIVR